MNEGRLMIAIIRVFAILSKTSSVRHEQTAENRRGVA